MAKIYQTITIAEIREVREVVSMVNSKRFWGGPLAAGSVGAVAALLMAGLSAFALRRLGQEMNWLAVLSGGAAGGLAGHLVLRFVLAWLDRRVAGAEARIGSMDRFVWLILSGLATSLVLGAAFLALAFSLADPGESGARQLGPRIFVLIGWLVGILASSVPLAILELQAGDRPVS